MPQLLLLPRKRMTHARPSRTSLRSNPPELRRRNVGVQKCAWTHGSSRAFARPLLGREREEGRLARRSVRDAFEFGVAMPEWLGNLDLAVGKHVDHLQCVDDTLTLEMIVGNDESGL